jgi:CDP-diacylglycerol--glycerol-3-phosphate 3-phosphatidyltransferase
LPRACALLDVVLSAPEVLIAFRAACAPAIFVLACFGFSGRLLAGVLLAAFLSDVFDGIVARRLGIATAALRQADTLVDTAFYAAAAAALWVAVPAVFDSAGLPLALIVAIHVSRTTFELTKYGRIASYHMWSSKALGILLVTAMTTVFLTGRPSVLVAVTLWFGVANELEGFFASVILQTWTADVASAVHAYRMTRVNAQLTNSQLPS